MADAEQALRGVLQNIAQEYGYDDEKTVICLFSTDGANFSSYLYKITLFAKGKDELRLFAKVACISESMRAQIPVQLYNGEIMFYTHLLKRYQELEERHNVPQQNRLATVKYYGSCEEYLKEVLVLEDLSSKGFEIHDRLISYDWEYAAKAVEEMAKLHALSIALFKNNPEELEILSKNLDMSMFTDQMKHMMHKIFDKTLSVVKEENRAKVESFLQNFQNMDVEYYYNVRRVAVITHGDFRPSNLMHRSRQGGEMEVFVLDYQTQRISNPISDLMYFIFSGSDTTFRKKHYRQLLDHYYKELCEALVRLDIDPENTYSKKDFDYELGVVQPLGLLIGIMIVPMLSVEAENAPDMSKSGTGIEDMVVKPNDLAVNRVNEIVDDFVRLGVL